MPGIMATGSNGNGRIATLRLQPAIPTGPSQVYLGVKHVQIWEPVSVPEGTCHLRGGR